MPALLLNYFCQGERFSADISDSGSGASQHHAETIPRGGWFPVAMGAIIFTVIATWRGGTELLLQSYEADAITIGTLLGRLEHNRPQRMQVKAFGQGLYELKLNYGFMQGFNIPSDLPYCIEHRFTGFLLAG